MDLKIDAQSVHTRARLQRSSYSRPSANLRIRYLKSKPVKVMRSGTSIHDPMVWVAPCEEVRFPSSGSPKTRSTVGATSLSNGGAWWRPMPPRRPIAGEGRARRNRGLVFDRRRATRGGHDGEELGGAITVWYAAGCPGHAMGWISGGAEVTMRH